MADPTLNPDDPTGGPAAPLVGRGGVSGDSGGAMAPSQGMTKHDRLVEKVLTDFDLLGALTANGGSFTTNQVAFSEDMSLATGLWTQTNATVSLNASLDPYGHLNGSKLVENSSAAAEHSNESSSFAVQAKACLSASVFCKAAERTVVYMGIVLAGGLGSVYVTYDLANLRVLKVEESGVGLPGTARIVKDRRGWIRLSFVLANSSAAVAATMVLGLADETGDSTYDGDGSSGAFFFGAQVESPAAEAHTYKKKPLDQGKPVQDFPAQDLTRMARDYATEAMAMRVLDLSDRDSLLP